MKKRTPLLFWVLRQLIVPVNKRLTLKYCASYRLSTRKDYSGTYLRNTLYIQLNELIRMIAFSGLQHAKVFFLLRTSFTVVFLDHLNFIYNYRIFYFNQR